MPPLQVPVGIIPFRLLLKNALKEMNMGLALFYSIGVLTFRYSQYGWDAENLLLAGMFVMIFVITLVSIRNEVAMWGHSFVITYERVQKLSYMAEESVSEVDRALYYKLQECGTNEDDLEKLVAEQAEPDYTKLRKKEYDEIRKKHKWWYYVEPIMLILIIVSICETLAVRYLGF